MKKIGKKNIIPLFSLICFGVVAYYSHIFPYFPIDLKVTRELQQINLGWFDLLMRFITSMGFVFTGSLITLVICSGMAIMGLKKQSALLFLSSTGLSFLGYLVKNIVDQPRPSSLMVRQIENFTKTDSFPSGHVLLFIGLFGFLAYIIYVEHRKTITRDLVLFLLAVLIVLIGVSRVYVGAHWFSDVMGSYLLGAVWLRVMAFVYGRVIIS